jgi:hypothetical protein
MKIYIISQRFQVQFPLNFIWECKKVAMYTTRWLQIVHNSKFFHQLFTIHGLENEHYVPLVFILLPNKDEKSYKCALQCIKEDNAYTTFDFVKIMSDRYKPVNK